MFICCEVFEGIFEFTEYVWNYVRCAITLLNEA